MILFNSILRLWYTKLVKIENRFLIKYYKSKFLKTGRFIFKLTLLFKFKAQKLAQ